MPTSDRSPEAPVAPGATWRPGSTARVPEPGAVDLWRIDLEASQGEPELLDPGERARAERFLVDAPRRQFARARAGLRRILGGALGVDPTAVRFEVGRHGRPSLAAVSHPEARRAGLDFNLSHSGTLALVAVAVPEPGSPLALGVDVEEERGGRRLDRLAERFFAPPEVAQYRALEPDERPTAFYRGWTRKEAYLKAWGTGLTFSSRRFTVDLSPVPEGELADLLRGTELAGDDGLGWRFADLRVGPGYAGALCLRGVVREIRRFELSPRGEKETP